MSSTPRALLVLFCLVAASVRPAQAQDEPLAETLVHFFNDGVRMTSGAAGTAGNPHEAHFIPGLSQNEAALSLWKSTLTQINTFPLGTSSGGFTYTLDSATGAITPSSNSFGPAFAERPLTIGKGRFNAGFNYQHVSYKQFEGIDLDSGNLLFYMQHNDCCPPAPGTPTNPTGIPTNPSNTNPFFEGDLIETRVNMKIKTDTTVFFANYGIANNLEVGVAVPFVRTDLRVGGRFTIIRLSTAGAPTIHSWDGSGATQSGTVKDIAEQGDSSSGIGDMLVRAKYVFKPGVIGAEVDFRLPTGDELELLGTGGTQTRLMLIVGGSGTAFSPHANIAYTFAGGELPSEAFEVEVPSNSTGAGALAGFSAVGAINREIPDEFAYTFGFDWAASRRVTINGDLLGRAVKDSSRFAVSNSTFNYRTATDGPILTDTRPQLNIDDPSSALNLLLLAVGTKLNIATNLLLTANVLFPLNDSGLKPGVTPTIGLDYAF